MVSITLFGKKWDFEIDTIKYFGMGLAVLYVLRIIKYVLQKYLGGKNTTPLASDTQAMADTKTTPVDSKETEVSKDIDADDALPSEKDKKINWS